MPTSFNINLNNTKSAASTHKEPFSNQLQASKGIAAEIDNQLRLRSGILVEPELPGLGSPDSYLPETNKNTLPPISPEIAALNIPPATIDHFSPAVMAAIERQATALNVNQQALARLIQVESSGNPGATSPSGRHYGLMQISDDIANRHGASNPFDPNQNIRAGVNDLKTTVATNLMNETGLPMDQLTVAHIYICHQQGAYGGPAIIKSAMDPADNRPAWQVLRDDVGLSEGAARSHINGNIPAGYSGNRDAITARQFFDIYRCKIGEPYASQPFFEPTPQSSPVASVRNP